MRAIVALCMAALVAAEAEVLTQDNFAVSIGSGQTYFIKFYAPWCGHCKRLAPTWDQLADSVKDSPLAAAGVHIAKVDCTVQKDVCQTQGVRGYPTLMLFKDGNTEGIKYSGSRELASLRSFVESHVKPADAPADADAAAESNE